MAGLRVLVILALLVVAESQRWPISGTCHPCQCYYKVTGFGRLRHVNCSQRRLREIPTGLPRDLMALDLSWNPLEPEALRHRLCKFKSLQSVSLSFADLTTLPAIFGDCSSVLELNLTGNRIAQLESTTFQGLKNLRRLLGLEAEYISSNEAFRGLTNLRDLDFIFHGSTLPLNLFHNMAIKSVNLVLTQAKALPRGIFSFGTKTLNVIQLVGEKVAELNEDLLKDLYVLNKLFLIMPQVDSLPKNFFQSQQRAQDMTKPSSLQEVEITGVGSIPVNLFNQVDIVQSLRLKDIGRFPRAGFLAGLVNLRTLVITGSQIESIPAGWFRELYSVKTLQLSGLEIEKLDEDAFLGLLNLNYLDLSYNNLPGISRKTLQPLSQTLESLILTGNFLTELSEGCLKGLFSLRYLDVSENRLSNVYASAFRGMTRMSVLYITSNRLTSLPTDLFKDQLQLESLSLSDNKFVEFPRAVLQLQYSLISLDLSYNAIRGVPSVKLCQFPYLERVSLANNPLHCDCSLLKFQSCQHIIVSGTCKTPASDAGKPIQLVDIPTSCTVVVSSTAPPTEKQNTGSNKVYLQPSPELQKTAGDESDTETTAFPITANRSEKLAQEHSNTIVKELFLDNSQKKTSGSLQNPVTGRPVENENGGKKRLDNPMLPTSTDSVTLAPDSPKSSSKTDTVGTVSPYNQQQPGGRNATTPSILITGDENLYPKQTTEEYSSLKVPTKDEFDLLGKIRQKSVKSFPLSEAVKARQPDPAASGEALLPEDINNLSKARNSQPSSTAVNNTLDGMEKAEVDVNEPKRDEMSAISPKVNQSDDVTTLSDQLQQQAQKERMPTERKSLSAYPGEHNKVVTNMSVEQKARSGLEGREETNGLETSLAVKEGNTSPVSTTPSTLWTSSNTGNTLLLGDQLQSPNKVEEKPLSSEPQPLSDSDVGVQETTTSISQQDQTDMPETLSPDEGKKTLSEVSTPTTLLRPSGKKEMSHMSDKNKSEEPRTLSTDKDKMLKTSTSSPEQNVGPAPKTEGTSESELPSTGQTESSARLSSERQHKPDSKLSSTDQSKSFAGPSPDEKYTPDFEVSSRQETTASQRDGKEAPTTVFPEKERIKPHSRQEAGSPATPPSQKKEASKTSLTNKTEVSKTMSSETEKEVYETPSSTIDDEQTKKNLSSDKKDLSDGSFSTVSEIEAPDVLSSKNVVKELSTISSPNNDQKELSNSNDPSNLSTDKIDLGEKGLPDKDSASSTTPQGPKESSEKWPAEEAGSGLSGGDGYKGGSNGQYNDEASTASSTSTSKTEVTQTTPPSSLPSPSAPSSQRKTKLNVVPPSGGSKDITSLLDQERKRFKVKKIGADKQKKGSNTLLDESASAKPKIGKTIDSIDQAGPGGKLTVRKDTQKEEENGESMAFNFTIGALVAVMVFGGLVLSVYGIRRCQQQGSYVLSGQDDTTDDTEMQSMQSSTGLETPPFQYSAYSDQPKLHLGTR